MDNLYNSFNRYLQNRFGCRVHRLNLNPGFNCPNLDGTLSDKGCIFCDNKAFSHFTVTSVSLEDQIKQEMEHARRRFKAEKFIAYFMSFSSTNAGIEQLHAAYSVIEKFPDIAGLSVSTRPDCIDAEKIKLLAEFKKKYEVYIEYGLQSARNTTLIKINRNHDLACFEQAVKMSTAAGLKTAAHIILGLPGETKENMLDTARYISELPLWGIKLHCLHVVKNTELEKMYRCGEVKLLEPAEYIDICVSFLELIPEDWVILRIVSDANKELLVAPRWINDKQKIINAVKAEFICRKTKQGSLSKSH